MQSISPNIRHSGWSDSENQLLWETADEAQQQGLPLKSVFNTIAKQTGRRPNSIRNYYYAQVRQHEGTAVPNARFVPFTPDEIDSLLEKILIARSNGQSVRACLQELANGDHNLMLRYQNKYRALLKSRPDYVRQVVERLQKQGIACEPPRVNHRVPIDPCAFQPSAQRRDAELSKALDVLFSRLSDTPDRRFTDRLLPFVESVKEFLACSADEQHTRLPAFCQTMTEQIGALESMLSAACPENDAL